MALPAAFTDLSGEAHPAALAPIGGARAAVVSNGEALGRPAPPAMRTGQTGSWRSCWPARVGQGRSNH
jgi:hypothetical protein